MGVEGLRSERRVYVAYLMPRVLLVAILDAVVNRALCWLWHYKRNPIAAPKRPFPSKVSALRYQAARDEKAVIYPSA